jgi:hypothetical protein
MHDRERLTDEAPLSGVALLEPGEIAALLADCPVAEEPSAPAQRLRIELARTHVPAEAVARWTRGSVATFDSPDRGAVDVYVNEQLAARGTLGVQEGRWCVRIVELVDDVPRTTREA